MQVFRLRERLIGDYGTYVRSFIEIRDERIRARVQEELDAGLLWPQPLIQLNPSFESGGSIEDLVSEGLIHEECRRIFRIQKSHNSEGKIMRLYQHQVEAIRAARGNNNYVLTTGTGSGKSLAYIVPIVDYVLRNGSGRGIRAVVVYPMNALANSQLGELQKFLCEGYPDGKGPVTFARYTGQEKDEERQEIIKKPPDILLTNYVMLELLLTRPYEQQLIAAAKGLQFLVLDELHTYRGRQGADVAMLVRRAREAFQALQMQCVGTSATLAGTGSHEQQRTEVAAVATALFGAQVKPEHVIGETLRRSTPDRDLSDPTFIRELTQRVADTGIRPPSRYQAFIEDPLSIWIEGSFGIRAEPKSGRLVRSQSRSVRGSDGAAHELSQVTGLPAERCAEAIEEQLLASYGSEPNPDTGFPVFAFRLHQFISRGDTVYASVEPETRRYITVHGQQFVPGDRSRVLLPLVFCRECGQEYYCVRSAVDRTSGQKTFSPRELNDRLSNEQSQACFIYVSSTDPWPTDGAQLLERLPDDWIEEHRGALRVRRDRQAWLPRLAHITPDGTEHPDGAECSVIPAPFRFCLSCGVAYGFRQASDFAKLASLGTEGRSTATTILSLAAIRYLRNDESLPERARKLLSFTDNRQDASLQAGHFNDFIEIGLLRSGLYRAVMAAGSEGLQHDELVQRVYEALNLPIELYAADPGVRFQALEETKRALRLVLAYRLYRDLQHGWRITSPNLEQSGLLEIHYGSLDELSGAQDVWEKLHPALSGVAPETREEVAKTLLDLMRRELTIKVDVLDPIFQERIQQQSSQRLRPPWAIDENEQMEHAAVLYPRSREAGDYGGHFYLSPRGAFGQYLRRHPQLPRKLSLDDTLLIIRDLLEALRTAGLVEMVDEPKKKDDVPGYQLPASALIWRPGDGTHAFHDPLRVPRAAAEGGRTNPFFIQYYRQIAVEGKGLEAREHTAQVHYDDRQDREARFREGKLPILYCSPTMELGVDIAQLNAVNLRNIPPTPANYAQRSGRAGRSGQPAIVFSYCTTYSPHDQYFFRRPQLMVSGAVTPPRLDLANEDLILAHVHAIWLAEAGLGLGNSLREVLDLSGDEPKLPLLPHVRAAVENRASRERAKRHAERVLEGIRNELQQADWYSDGWLDEALSQVARRFDDACDRWRGLYRAALRQRDLQHRIISDASRSADDKKKARRLRAEAEAQIDLLTEAKNAIESDFYSYRYFASEGFLPGYNFPRLPLSAYIPARRQKGDEFVSRPRFLAISEFGPRAIVYHEGSRYRINKVILTPERDAEGDEIVTTSIKQCGECGYLHPARNGNGADLCEHCHAPLQLVLAPLFRLQNVSTKRADKISSDEEERLRLGYEIVTGVRFAEYGGHPASRTATVTDAEGDIAALTYGHAATLWRINLGWRRRAREEERGFVLDVERGYWKANSQDTEDEDDPLSARTRRVIPYVEDRRNCLLLAPNENLDEGIMASLQAALKHAIQVRYQLEESELAAEPLPARSDRRLLLIFEAAEGGAGVLRRLLDDAGALKEVAREALRICHFDPDTGADQRRAPGAREDCEAACYDCLMSYSNQPDHRVLDRKLIKDVLLRLGHAEVEASPAPVPRAEHLAQLMRQCGSDLERDWLRFIDEHGFRLPSNAQTFIENCKTRPDFLYAAEKLAVYVDGPHHEYPERRERDHAQTDCMEDAGYTVLRFGTHDDWAAIAAKHPNVFGVPQGH
ncbi:MAG: DEAD/DEAH box helicase [Candidatus Binatia bacterium]|jgi:ATP-dependent helicase YprA (DUF1998 family)/very-short-patch-repair endonuclease